MIDLGPNIALSFILGVVAAVNPCGFVMLPAYLAYYLGEEAQRRSGAVARIRRALLVGTSLSAGFIAVFIVIGTLVRTVGFLAMFPRHARWAGLATGVGMVVAGIAMILGWSPRLVGTQRAERGAITRPEA